MNEADTCRKYVVPKLRAAGWDEPPHAISEQRTFTDGRVLFVGGKAQRGRQKRADSLLRYRPDFPIAVVEAKAHYRHAAEGLQQAKNCAEILGLRFACATNGDGIVEFDSPRVSNARSRIFRHRMICGPVFGTPMVQQTTLPPSAFLRRHSRTVRSRCDTTRRSLSTVRPRRSCKDTGGRC